jgi:HAD domain in Swiss Army Knife RNA repair proteins
VTRPVNSASDGGRVRDPRVEKPVLFLDVDDVLCLNKPYGAFAAAAAVRAQHVNPEAVYRELFAPAAVLALKRLHNEMTQGIRYVISSTWRESFTRHELVTVFHRAGLGFVAENLAPEEQWRTLPKPRRSQRIHEIAQWLDEHHKGEPFAIVDDTHSGASLLLSALTSDPQTHPFAGRVVLCKEGVGLTDAHVVPLLDALRRDASLEVGTVGAANAWRTL